jgi:hypothetical protein
MNGTRALLLIKRIASIALALCFVLPLSRCQEKVDPAGRAPTAASSMRGLDLAKEGWREVQAGKMSDGAGMLLAVFAVFFVPIVCLKLGERVQAVICLLGSLVSAFFLYFWVFAFSTRAEFGGFIAVACWAVLFSAHSINWFRLSRHGGLFRWA